MSAAKTMFFVVVKECYFLFSSDIKHLSSRLSRKRGESFLRWAGASDLSFNCDFSSNRFASLKRSVVVALSFLR